MKFCPECGVQLVSQKFCHECGANISNYLNKTNATNTFDFSSLQMEAQKQLNNKTYIKKH